MASNVRLFLLLLTICTVAGVQTAEQRQAPAAAPDSCGLIDPRLVSNTTCNGSCRTAIHGALVDIYNNLKGFNWSWGNLEDHAELRTPAAAVWRPDSSECVSCTLQSGEVAPSYCCWEGAVCCGEHHNYIGELGEVTCQPYSVVLLQLRSGNVAGNLGSIMPQLQLLHAHGMAYLDLSRNSITGAIPEAIGSLNKLHVLMLGSNYISGTVPASFSRLNKLSLLDLEFNFLQGSLSPQQLCPAGNVLQAVYLRANNFTGSLNLTACRRLEVADIQENGFTGPLPIGRTNRQLAVLRARLNDFSGTIPIDVWELPQLMTFDVTNNSLSGSLPQNGSPSVFLTNLYLGSNNLSGQVPRGMSESSQLSKLDLSDNFMLTGTLPEMKWMQGLQQLSISNTLISGTIPEALSQLPYLESVDMHNTLMTCCGNWSDVQSRTPAQLLPAFLTFDADLKRSPSNEMLGHNPLLNAYMNTGQNMLCDSVRRDPGHQTVSTSLVLRPANLSRQAWSVDPEYFWFQRCACINGYTARYQNSAAAVWCNSSLHPPGSAAAQRCIEMRVLTCVKKPPLAKEEIAGVVSA
uniref:Leucine-rich repeat-containing N-terminal plant-type domain-containing protein n=1 Tax=Tetradesmus obliquus TaxID=3088 RepID=A0A383VRU3_TETOB|eukprot:jgi/Sobl393_1/17104/SZX68245.1